MIWVFEVHLGLLGPSWAALEALFEVSWALLEALGFASHFFEFSTVSGRTSAVPKQAYTPS